MLGEERRRDAWRVTLLLRGHAAIYGIVPDGVTGVRVTIDGETAEVAARDNVVGGVLPFPYRDKSRVAYVRGSAATKPRVGVVDAGGDAGAVVRRLQAAGYHTVDGPAAGGHAPPTPSIVYWWPGTATLEEALAVARTLPETRLVEAIRDTAETPRPVLDTDAPVVVVAGRP